MPQAGVLVIDKPQGLTSRRAAVEVGRLAGNLKSGHAGALDPLATGVLVVCLGRATLLTRFLGAGSKEYHVQALLGVETDTYDMEGTIVQKRRISGLELEDVKDVISDFLGSIQQMAPVYSAVKHKGRPLYQYARAGVDIERKPRTVNMELIEAISLSDSADQRLLKLRVICGPGTYIRSLVHDIGKSLGCGACVAGLRRLRSGVFGIDRSVTFESLVTDESRITKSIITIEEATAGMPSVRVGEEGSIAVGQGKPLRDEWISDIECELSETPGQAFRVLDSSGRLLALYGPRRPSDELKIVARPVRVLRPLTLETG